MAGARGSPDGDGCDPRVVSSLSPHGRLQPHFLDRKTTYTRCRCAWTGQARAIATMADGDWRAPPICRSCYNGLMPHLKAN
jgi:hypothetical protein